MEQSNNESESSSSTSQMDFRYIERRANETRTSRDSINNINSTNSDNSSSSNNSNNNRENILIIDNCYSPSRFSERYNNIVPAGSNFFVSNILILILNILITYYLLFRVITLISIEVIQILIV